MNEQIRSWLNQEMQQFSVVLKQFRKKVNKKVWLWMVLSVVGMSALGICVGYDISYVLRVHFLIGCGIALFIGLCFWLQGKATSIGKVKAAYEKEIGAFFVSEDDRDAFCRQMESGDYGTADFFNTTTDSCPGRLVIGPAYWIYFRNGFCRFYRTDDILYMSEAEETMDVSYKVGGKRVRQNMSAGMSLSLTYRADSPSAASKREGKLFFEKGEQFNEAMDLIRKYCPQCKQWM